MPRQVVSAVENNFKRGLITEATGLNFPEDACTDTDNCFFEQDGTVKRRLGIDYEDDYTLNTIGSSLEDRVFNSYYWKNVAGDGNRSFLVVQFGRTLTFYESDPEESLSASIKSFTFDLTEKQVAGSPTIGEIECYFTSGNGDLFVFHPYCDPFYIAYDPDADDITATTIEIKIRDFDGVTDNLEIEERPTILSTEHKYNLYNQGWYPSVPIADNDGGGTAQVVTHWDNQRSDYPSNAEIWWLYRNTENKFEIAGSSGVVFVNALALGNRHAPKGHFILDAFFQDRSDVSGIPGLDVISASYFRPSVGQFHNSRVFFAGVNYKDWSSKIYFSPTIITKKNYGECYQVGDPTSEDNFDLLKTDGGVVVIPELGTVVAMHSLGNYLLVFASNGVWALAGSDALGFSATDYAVQKISSVPSLSASSFVDVEGSPVWWNSDGIYTVVADQATGQVNVNSITDQTIADYFDDIPSANFKYVRGAYNPFLKIVSWLYKSTSSSTLAENYQFDKALNLNRLTGAFCPWSIIEIESGPQIVDITVTTGFGASFADTQVVDSSGNTIIDGSSNNVIVTGASSESLTGTLRFVTVVLDSSTYKLTFSQEQDSGYIDWFSFDGAGESYSSFFITGYKVHAEGLRNYQINYIVVYSRSETNSSCFVQGLWDYATSGDTGRWSTPQQVYPGWTNSDHQFRRLKIRGKGKACQLKFFSEEGKPFNIIGWTSFELQNAMP